MNVIRKLENKDKGEVIKMMQVFYSSPAVFTNGSMEIFESDVNACVSDNPYLEGYVFETDGKISGYAMIAKSFSTEWGKQCIWVEDIYVKESFRRQGLADLFFKTIEKKYPNAIKRLEVEEDNEVAVKAYEKNGFTYLPYKEMRKD